MHPATPRIHARTGLTVTALGLGCAQMGGLYRPTSLEEAAGAFRAAWDRGIRYYDTAPFYGFTRSERRLGTFLTEEPRSDYVVSTKVGRVMVPDPTVGAMEEGYADPLPFRPTFDYSHDGILRSFEASRQRLGILAPDILYVHDIGRVTHGERHAQTWEQLTTGGGFRALMRLREEGAVRGIGLGVNEWEIVAEAIQVADLDLCMLAGRYTLLEQDSLPLMDECARRGVGIVVAGAFNSGLLAGKAKFNYADAPPALVARTQALRAACEEEGVRLEAAALQFPLLHPAALTLVTGARNAAQVEANAAWFAEPVPDGFWARLKARGLVHDAAPV
ncbi:D-threo-aldose 1-dehydrogenase [Methylobacterium sp. 174MFSha1.1]|uniref:aldo/keto reductase n=1 Tax=Methylobacterium sp. 174MFSha1.1 TaxID=1502749 RepID=UPI0008F428B7|nr:aldo/keto reductase [Methylobacterium sp. 174MFSha1.1]SFU90068.1 D-threo-aldose 1-dehydrogenase [Methylobacterium sp. 174MFSha1.1]